ncbi:MAG: hypothetical protein IGQ88_00155 [Gloeomargaritaceae cyanobacterium C42_A2020_066]|nr:hypothetical protein [Gloeomargaritaceae cyanobacterium C42_A2020_066]
MPLLKLQTSLPAVPDGESLLRELSRILAAGLGKSESYVMTLLLTGLPMTFAGEAGPTCYLEIKSIGAMTPQQTHALSQALCTHLHDALGVPAGRIYIEFGDVRASHWGWNGQTFASR